MVDDENQENQTPPVEVEYGGNLDDPMRAVVQNEVNPLIEKLQGNENLRIQFVKDPMEFLAREGLLAHATALGIRPGANTSWADIVLAQSLTRGETRGDIVSGSK